MNEQEKASVLARPNGHWMILMTIRVVDTEGLAGNCQSGAD
jgi:hypothetical protein